MQIEIEFWQLVTLVLGVIGAFAGIGKMLFVQFGATLNERFASLKDSIDKVENDSSNWQRLEKEFLMLQRDLPLHYVRREDYVRNQSVIESKLDALALKLENWQLKEINKK